MNSDDTSEMKIDSNVKHFFAIRVHVIVVTSLQKFDCHRIYNDKIHASFYVFSFCLFMIDHFKMQVFHLVLKLYLCASSRPLIAYSGKNIILVVK